MVFPIVNYYMVTAVLIFQLIYVILVIVDVLLWEIL
jgi:hypothetical protein